jgi:hypothetical protein
VQQMTYMMLSLGNKFPTILGSDTFRWGRIHCREIGLRHSMQRRYTATAVVTFMMLWIAKTILLEIKNPQGGHCVLVLKVT